MEVEETFFGFGFGFAEAGVAPKVAGEEGLVLISAT